MTASPLTRSLLAAARFELATRAERYPRLVVDGRLDADVATLDWQAWHAICDWLDSGTSRLLGLAGGVNTDKPRTIDWDLLDSSATKAVASVQRSLAKAPDGDARAALVNRLALVEAIAERVRHQRLTLATLTGQLRELARERQAA